MEVISNVGNIELWVHGMWQQGDNMTRLVSSGHVSRAELGSSHAEMLAMGL